MRLIDCFCHHMDVAVLARLLFFQHAQVELI